MSKHSIEAYINIQDKIRPQERRIIELLVRGKHNLRQVCKVLAMATQTVSARLSELHDKGYVTQDSEGYYSLTSPDNIQAVKARRDYDRFMKWRKLGEREGYFKRIEQENYDAMSREFDDNGNPLQEQRQFAQHELPF